MGLQKVFFNNTSKKILKRKEERFLQERDGYQSLDIQDATLYKQGELFIQRCIRGISMDLDQTNADSAIANTNELFKMNKNGNRELSKMEIEILRFYTREYQRKKYTHSIEQNKGLLNRRRNAVCEQSMEERIGLGLCLQRHQHNEYMMDYEM